MPTHLPDGKSRVGDQLDFGSEEKTPASEGTLEVLPGANGRVALPSPKMGKWQVSQVAGESGRPGEGPGAFPERVSHAARLGFRIRLIPYDVEGAGVWVLYDAEGIPVSPRPLPAPASSWQPGARLRPWRPATVSSFAAASQRRISRPVVSCGQVAATRSRTRDSWPWCPSRSPRCVACGLFVLKKVGREKPCETTPGAKSDPYKAHVLPEHRGTVASDGRRKRKQPGVSPWWSSG
nr:uncharacterized protein LOC102118633 [Macaca fascicularis]